MATLDRPGPPTSSTLSPRRLNLLLVGMVLLLAAVGTRTVYLQSVKNRTLTQYAKGQQQNTQPLPAVRGDIVDRKGRELAVGEEAVTFFATPKLLGKNRAGTALEVSKILKLSRSQEDELVDRLTNATGGFVYVARQVRREDAEKLEAAKLPGIQWNDEEKRMYPAGPVAGQLVGFVDVDNKGLEGIESLYDSSLTGTPGQQVAVMDPTGVPIDVLKLRREQDGKDVQLTIDLTLQQEAEQVLARTMRKFEATYATAIVMDPRSGEILAMAQAPRVNPAKWGVAPAAARRNLAITDQYEPGSTFKVVTVSAALEEGVTTPSTRYRVPSVLHFCDDVKTCTVHDSHNHGVETLTTKDILVQSSNIGTIKLAQAIRDKYLAKGQHGNAAIESWMRRFGFGAPTGVDFPGEIPGIVTPAKDWSDVSIGNIPIGQGVAVTPLQLATAYATIANDGVRMQPHLLKQVGSEPPVVVRGHRVLSTRTAATMRGMFSAVVTDDMGTGRKASIAGYKVAGKTGTAQMADPSGGYYAHRFDASFVGFVPANNPRLVTLVMVHDPKGSYFGGDVAAPAFEEITKFAINYLAIAQDGVL
jgi:cell division protein FtsI/penicillin-binding protein 2